ncbi:MAG: acyltransferase family protein, partial [Pseudomonadota bacterium]
MTYRADINGLRSIAVMAVIVHHAGFAPHGGFLGVDIFFVISGFLITGILLRDLDEERFSLKTFYNRRIRRILPALVFVGMCTLPFAWTLMSPEQFAHFGRTLIALPLFATNFIFWRESGYFEPDSAEIPLIHTWSLAVEEQFYVFFPLTLLLIWWLGRRLVLPFLLLGLAGGLILAEYGVRHHPSAAFYLLPFRAWELLAGAVAAVLAHRLGRTGEVYSGLRPVPAHWNNALAGAGLTAVTISLIVFLPESGSPGYKVAPLVAGTVLILLFTTPGTLVYRLLALRGMVGIGVISYSAYLWHQPLFAFARIASFEPPSAAMMLALIVLTLGLAWLSWWLIEEPFRRRLPLRAVYGSVLAGFAGFIALGLIAHNTEGLTGARFAQPQVQWFETVSFSPKRDACHDRPERLPPPDQACIYFGDAAPGWAVLGDSHGVELAYALGRALEPRGETVVQLTASACAPAYTFESLRKDCSRWTRTSVDWLAAHPDIDTVVLAYRHIGHLYPNLDPTPHGTPKIVEGTSDSEKRALYWQGFSEIVRRLSVAGQRIVILEPVPE